MEKKFLFLIASFFAIFLLGSVSAVDTLGEWSNNASSIQITNGQSAVFTAYSLSLTPPMTINIKLYNSTNALVHSFESNRIFSGNGFTQGYTITPAIYSAVGSYTLVISGSDSVSSHSTSLTLNVVAVPPANSPPVITTVPVTQVNEGQAYSYDVNATDADGNTLAYSITGNPGWLVINSTTGLITGTAPTVTADTNYSVTVSVTDGAATVTQAYTITVRDVPVVNNIPIAQNQSLTTAFNTAIAIQVSATDTNNDALTYSIVSGPLYGTLTPLNPSTGAVTYTPILGFSGSDNFKFKANDGQADSNTATISITVNSIVNSNPIITVISPNGGETWSGAQDITWNATDADGDTLIIDVWYSEDNGATWTLIAFNEPNDGIFSWDTTTVSDGSSYLIGLDAYDALSFGSDNSDTVFTIANNPGNNAPVITTTAVTQVNEGAAYSYDVNATDADGNTLTYSLATAPSWLTISATTGLITGTAPAVAVDTVFPVTVSVTDGIDNTTQSFNVTVTNIVPPVNSAPTISSTPLTSVNENQNYVYQVNATDVDGDTLTYALTTAPAWLTISSTTGLITGTAPSVSANTNFPVTVSVSDGTTATTQSYNITVNNVIVPPANSPPVINSTAITQVNENSAYTYDVNATDVDGDVLLYSLQISPAWLTINPVTGLISGTAPAVSADTNFTITIGVTDGTATVTQVYTLTVLNVPSSSDSSRSGSGGKRILLGNGLDEKKYASQFAPKTVVADDSAELASETGNSRIWIISFWVIVFVAFLALGVWLIGRLLR